MSEEATPIPVAQWAPRFVWIVFGMAFLLRLWGIGWGLPSESRHWSYHPDEPVIYAYSQQVEPTKLDFEPGFYNYGTLYLTLLRVVGDVAKTYAGAGDQLWAQAGAAHVAGRWISALAGAGTAAVLFLLLRRRVGDIGALFGAGLIAFAPGFVIHSRFQTVDVLATFFLALSAHNALKLLDEDTPLLKCALLSGLFAGLSAGTKYTGILALLTLLTVVVVARRKEAAKLFGAGAGAAVGIFLIVTPGVFLNTAKFLEDFKYEMQHTSTGHGLVFAGLPTGFAWHLYNLIIGVGPVLLAVAFLGLAWAAVRKDRAAWALLAFFLVYYVLIGRAEVLFLRYTFPLLIGLAYGVGWLVSQSWGQPKWARLGPAFAMLGLGGVFGGGLAASGSSSIWMSNPDPRDDVIEKELHDELGTATIGLVADPWFYTPPFYPETGAPRWVPFEQQMAWMAERKIVRYVPDNPAERFDWDVRLLTETKPNYVVFSSFETEGLDRLRLSGPQTDLEKLFVERYVSFGERLKLDYTLVGTRGGTGWNVHDLEYVRPFMWVWKRKPTP